MKTARKKVKDSVLLRAIRLAGGRTRVARGLGISGAAVSQWDRCPAERAHDLSQMTGGEVTPQQLRPDIFREPPPVREAS